MSEQIATTLHTALEDPQHILAVLDSWADAGWIRALDVEFARFLYHETDRAAHPPVNASLLLAAALTSHQTAHGHVCLDLQACLAAPERILSLPPEYSLTTPDIQPAQILAGLDLDIWLGAIDQAPITGRGRGNSPLVLEQNIRPLLYLRRYWQHEQSLGRAIQERLSRPVEVDTVKLRGILDSLFETPRNAEGDLPLDQYDWQKIACALAVRYPFSVITGGPGTGKTTTVVRLLATLLTLQNDIPRIRLAAPTGKAATRLSASIRAQLEDIPGGEQIPSTVTTIHRLLGPVHGSRFFRHNAHHPLPVDVVVIDEASMVDVELMAQLFDALPAHARLVLLGDKDQLASVEAGALLGTLCQRAADIHYTADTVGWLEQITGQRLPASVQDDNGQPLDQAITLLRHSHRFGASSGIGALARAINTPKLAAQVTDTSEINDIFRTYDDVTRLRIVDTSDAALERMICDPEHGYGYYLRHLQESSAAAVDDASYDAWALGVITAHSRFQLLTALRKGEFGVESLNRYIRQVLQRRQLLPASAHETGGWYSGRPVMVTRNDYNLGLMNGDVGITLTRQGRLRVAFPDSSAPARVRWILPSRLQSVETVFAMTVHKSQGSEFVHTALILPPHDSPVLTRELIYTGITRARSHFTLIESHPAVLPQAVANRVFRISGLLA